MKILYVEQSERQFDHFKRNINANSKFKSNLKVFTTLLLANFILSPEQVNAEEMVESIVVTATRKAESILSVPIAIDTLSAGKIESFDVDTTNDLSSYFPGVEIRAVSSSEQAKAWIRGSGSIDFASNTNPTVGVYIDDVYLPNTFQHTAPIFDLERIEVLKGPQGTRYGRNVTGGLIKYVTAKPEDTFSGYFDLGVGSFNEIKSAGAITGPISETTNFRFAYKYVNDDGWASSRASEPKGDGFPGTLKNNSLNAENLLATRLLLDWNPSTLFNYELMIHSMRRRADGGTFQYVGIVDPVTYEPTCDPRSRIDCIDYLGYRDSDGVGERGDTSAGDHDFFGDANSDSYGLYGKLNYDFPAFSVKHIIAFDRFKRDSQYDADGGAYMLSNNYYKSNFKTASSEFQITSNAQDEFDWDLGLYISSDELSADNKYVFFGLETDQEFYQKQLSKAIYGNLKYPLTSGLYFLSGLRYTNDSVYFDHYSIRPTALDFAPGDVEGSISDQTFTDISWTIGLQQEISENTMLYSTVSNGYKSGGAGAGFGDPGEFNSYKPEDLMAYEVGFKSSLFAGRVVLDTAFYYYDYRDIHVFDVTSNQFGGQNFIVTNASKGIYKGGEIGANINLNDYNSINLGLSFIHAKYTDFISANGENLSGNDVPFAPPLKVVISYDSWWNLFSDWETNLNLRVSYTDSVFHDVRNNPLLTADSYFLSDIALSTTRNDGKYKYSISINNLTDEQYRVQSFDFIEFGSVTHVPNKPRNISIKFKYSFE